VYDEETGLYYLRSRYYNPEWGRFINADALTGKRGELLNHNIFAYCSGNPINFIDIDGLKKFSYNVAYEIPGSALYEFSIHFNHGRPLPGRGSMEHIHIFPKNNHHITLWSSNRDGTPHDGKSMNLPSGVKKSLQENGIWNWGEDDYHIKPTPTPPPPGNNASQRKLTPLKEGIYSGFGTLSFEGSLLAIDLFSTQSLAYSGVYGKVSLPSLSLSVNSCQAGTLSIGDMTSGLLMSLNGGGGWFAFAK